MAGGRSAIIGKLVRWLGPWTGATARPQVRRDKLRVDGQRPFDVWHYLPRRGEVRGQMFVLPGLHYLGPADPRLDRFLAILADAGIESFSPLLPEFRHLSVAPALVDDSLAAFDVCRARVGGRLGVFSISFGSYPAIHLAAARPEHVRAVTMFGGYASFEDVIRFSLGVDRDKPLDPLNRPVIFLNLLDHLEGLPDDVEPLRAAWTEYVRSSWGREWMKHRDAYVALSDRIAARLPAEHREMFEMGTGAIEGGISRALAALERGRASLAHLDAKDACERVRCPVAIVHGRDDDVIPVDQAEKLRAALSASPDARVYLTGLYGHTVSGGVDLDALGQELRSLVGIVNAIAGTAAD
ncbi:MAG: hypothetical protein AB7S26_36040 [Sandaracinaceae bacterium]